MSRIIPARAGFTLASVPSWSLSGDHPRSRGVYYAAPRHRSASLRIIPARAGFTAWIAEDGSIDGDHPRSRGVYWAGALFCAAASGSSPLARGLLGAGVRLLVREGIIPARAGFTSVRPLCGPGSGDHPRSRGVYPCHHSCSPASSGSSPLARGLRGHRHRPRRGRRIIPARAGFTSAPTRCRRGVTDHPRSRGVYTTRWRRPLTRRGSSPLARGLLPGRRRGHGG